VKNFFSVFGIIVIFLVCFLFAEKTELVLKNMDEIMIKIKENKDYGKVETISPIINGKDIILGISGQKININKSYSNMKRIGYYKETLLEYQKIRPKISIENNFDYYIIDGNQKKNIINIIILVKKDISIKKVETILEIAKVKNIKLNFFIDGHFFEKNNELINKIVINGHEIGSLGYNHDYKDSSFIWMNTIIKKLTNKNYGYCYLEKEDSSSHKICSLYKNYVIKPKIIINKNYFLETKKVVDKNTIISYEIKEDFDRELVLIINYIKAKGKEIETLKKLIDE